MTYTMERNIQSRIFTLLKPSTLSDGDNDVISLGGK